MKARRIIFAAALLLLAAFAPAYADDQTILKAYTDSPVAKLYAEAMTLVEKGDYQSARDVAQKIFDTEQWKSGDLEAAGAIRSVGDELRAKGQEALAKTLVATTQKKALPSPDVAKVLAGERLSPAVMARKVPVYVARTTTKALPASSTDKMLGQLRVGNQASILKIMDAGGKNTLFMKGLDGVLWAPLLDEHRQGIYAALAITPASLSATANKLLTEFPKLSKKREAMALLGAIGSDPTLDAATRGNIERLLLQQMTTGKNTILHRQACLNLALLSSVDPTTVDKVIAFYQSGNLWETFPVQQFFEYHKDRIKAMANYSTIKTRVAAVNSLYTANIMKSL
ncbi:MAG: hypothetical protein FJX76_02125 [Armatimonadetes bacterium]|nr:hypothetical protein [Armatimonadota bacterium]